MYWVYLLFIYFFILLHIIIHLQDKFFASPHLIIFLYISNGKIIASILQSAFIDYISKRIPPNSKNQSHLQVTDRIKPRTGGCLNANDNSNKNSGNAASKEEMIINLPKKYELSAFYNEKLNYYENIKTLIWSLSEKLYILIEKSWQESEKQRRKSLESLKVAEKTKILNLLKKK